MAKWFSTKVQKPFNGERTQVATKGAGKLDTHMPNN